MQYKVYEELLFFQLPSNMRMQQNEERWSHFLIRKVKVR